MKKLIFYTIILLLEITPVHAQSFKLPNQCRKLLTNKFSSWQLADVSAEIKDYFKRERANAQPNIIKGDWNGDGQTDYAVLLKKKAERDKTIIVVFLRKQRSFKNYILDGFDCILTQKKSEKGFDFDAKKTFRYRNDAIESWIWEKAGTTYVWEKGKFKAILTSD